MRDTRLGPKLMREARVLQRQGNVRFQDSPFDTLNT